MARTGKKEAILAAAERLFLTRGFLRVSMDDIASAAPVSKPTLYTHFEDKADLFLAVVAKKCAEFMCQIEAEIDNDEVPEKALFRLGLLFLDRIFRPDALNALRAVVAAGDEFPGIGVRFYASGPKRMQKMVADYLAVQHRKKRLKVPDPAAAAEMFMGLLKGNRQTLCLLGIVPSRGKKEMEKTVRYAVEIFLAAHRAAS
jgi:TetR/AcrR family transcriptional repressor of mexJK operon